MKKKVITFLKNYKMAIITICAVLIIGFVLLFCYLFFINRNEVLEYSNNYYSLKYDRSWKIKESKDDIVTLKHQNNGQIKIELITLEGEYRYAEIDDLIDNILYNINSSNPTYSLLAKEKTNISKNNYEGYKLLYKEDNSQVLVMVTKKSNKLIVFTYSAPNEYFDILLDSAKNVINNFDTLEDTFILNNNLDIEFTAIKWNSNKALSSDLKDTSNYEIANNNYLVNYSIPSNFKLSAFDSTSGSFTYSDLEKGSIAINVNIKNINLYEYLLKEDYGYLKYEFKAIKENDLKYLNYNEALEKCSDEECYIYKASYTSLVYSETNYEYVYLLTALDKNHILVIKIEAIDNVIPKELIEKIKINSITNYSSYIKKEIKDNYLVGTLKRYNEKIIDTVDLFLPIVYNEIDKGTNVYSNRYYGLDYNEDNKIYNYEISYYLTYRLAKIEEQIDVIDAKDNYHNNYQSLKFNDQMTINDKQFEVYDSSYSKKINISLFKQKEIIVNKKTLFYKIDDGGYIIIEIIGNGVRISNEQLKEATNFDIEETN